MRPHARGPAAVAQRVFDEGRQNLPELSSVGQDRTLGLVEENEGTSRRLELVLPFLAGRVEDLENVNGLGLAGLTLGDVEQLRDHVRHALDLFEAGAGFGAHLILSGDEFDFLQAHGQGGQRRAQLVGGVGGRLSLGCESARHAFAGAREFFGDQVDLLNAGLLHAGAHAARADLLGLGGQVDERGRQLTGQGARERPADHHGSDHAPAEQRARPRDAVQSVRRRRCELDGNTARRRGQGGHGPPGEHLAVGHEVGLGNLNAVAEFVAATVHLIRHERRQGCGVIPLPHGAPTLDVLEDELCLNVEVTLFGRPDGRRREEGAGQAHQHTHDGNDGDDHPHRASAHGGPPSATRSARVLEAESHPAHSRDVVRVGRVVTELATQPRHVHVESLRGAGRIRTPHLAHEVVASNDGTGLAQEHAQQVEFLGRQAQLDVAHEGAMRGHIHADVLSAQLTLGRFGSLATQERPHASEELCEAEGLRHIVVCARVQADDHVDFVRARSKDQNRDSIAGGSDLAGDIQAIHVGQAEVQDDQVNAANIREGFSARRVCAHVVALPAQCAGEGLGDGRIVFNEENCSHAYILAILNQNLHLS